MHGGTAESCRVVALVMQTMNMAIDKLAHIWYPFDLRIARKKFKSYYPVKVKYTLGTSTTT